MWCLVRMALATAMVFATLLIAPGGLEAMPAGLKSNPAQSLIVLARRECIAWDRYGKCIRWGHCGRHVC